LAKKQKTELKRAPTKRQLSRWQRQQRVQRIVIIAVSLFLALIVGYIGYGYYDQQVKPFHEPVVKINGTVFDMDYYIKLLRLYSQGKDSSEVSAIADRLIDAIESGEAIREASTGLGFGVSPDEIDGELDRAGLPDDKVYRDVISSTLLSSKLLKDYFDPKVPTQCEQAQVQAIFVESEEVANDVIKRLEAGEDFGSLAKEYSLEAVTKEKGGDLGWLLKGFTSELLGDLGNSHLEDIAFSLEPGMLGEPTYDGSVTKGIGYWLLEVVEKDETKGSDVRGMLLGSRQEAEEIRAKIEAGGDFGSLAKEYSQDSASKEQGGDLGWILPGGMPQTEVINMSIIGHALQLQPGVLSQPLADESIQTKGGYWVVKVVDKDASRAVGDDIRETLKLSLFEDWIYEQMGKLSVERYLSQEQKSWALDRVLKNRG
jgi:parvulin-like peptidyl-prolyl isomerase